MNNTLRNAAVALAAVVVILFGWTHSSPSARATPAYDVGNSIAAAMTQPGTVVTASAKVTYPCNRIYYTGSKGHPSKLRLSCNGGTTELSINTTEFKVNKAYKVDVTKGKGKYRHTLWLVKIKKSKAGVIEYQMLYDTCRAALRKPSSETAAQTRNRKTC